MQRVRPMGVVLALITVGTASAGGLRRLEAVALCAGGGHGWRCRRGLPHGKNGHGPPKLLRIDCAHKAIVGPKQTSPILFMDTSDIQLLLHGKEYVRNHGFSNSSL